MSRRDVADGLSVQQGADNIIRPACPSYAGYLDIVCGSGTTPHPRGLKSRTETEDMAYLDDLNHEPVVHIWSYGITLPA